MDIAKYFDLLQKTKFCLTTQYTASTHVIQNATAQNHWLTEKFVNQKINIILNTFFDNNNLLRLYHALTNTKLTPKKIALTIDDNIIFSGLYHLLFSCVCEYTIEIKCLPFHQTLLEPIVDILNTQSHTIIFTTKPTAADIYILHKKLPLSPVAQTYFQRHTHIPYSAQKASVVIEGNETQEQLILLAQYIAQFFGLENGNIGKIYVPENYDFNPLFENLVPYFYFKEFAHYVNQYDYHLASCILQKKKYFTNGLFTFYQSKEQPFSPISTIAFETYDIPPKINQLHSTSTSYVCKATELQSNTFEKLEQQYIQAYLDQWIKYTV